MGESPARKSRAWRSICPIERTANLWISFIFRVQNGDPQKRATRLPAAAKQHARAVYNLFHVLLTGALCRHWFRSKIAGWCRFFARCDSCRGFAVLAVRGRGFCPTATLPGQSPPVKLPPVAGISNVTSAGSARSKTSPSSCFNDPPGNMWVKRQTPSLPPAPCFTSQLLFPPPSPLPAGARKWQRTCSQRMWSFSPRSSPRLLQ